MEIQRFNFFHFILIRFSGTKFVKWLRINAHVITLYIV